jgi:hypothetical protein
MRKGDERMNKHSTNNEANITYTDFEKAFDEVLNNR